MGSTDPVGVCECGLCVAADGSSSGITTLCKWVEARRKWECCIQEYRRIECDGNRDRLTCRQYLRQDFEEILDLWVDIYIARLTTQYVFHSNNTRPVFAFPRGAMPTVSTPVELYGVFNCWSTECCRLRKAKRKDTWIYDCTTNLIRLYYDAVVGCRRDRGVPGLAYVVARFHQKRKQNLRPFCDQRVQRDNRELILRHGWSPETHKLFRNYIRRRVVVLFLCARRQQTPLFHLPAELLYSLARMATLQNGERI